jgi:hypothetical protein
MVGAQIGRHHASRISTSPWIHYNILNSPSALKKLNLASNNENSSLPLSNPEKCDPQNIVNCIRDLLVGHPEQLISMGWKTTRSWFSCG